MSYTIPVIVNSNDLSKRAYITFYFNELRVRKYNADALEMKIEPNRAKSLKSRNQLLEKLRYEYHKALDQGTFENSEKEQKNVSKVISSPKETIKQEVKPLYKSTEELLKETLDEKLNSSLSRKYKRDLSRIHAKFMAYLTDEEKQGSIDNVTTVRVQKFLNEFGSTGTYYMNTRRNLAVLFNHAAALEDKNLKTIKSTPKRKAKAKLHEKYEKEQLKPILNFLKDHHHNLYICCLLTYSSWLRPHEEIRLLTPRDFRNDLTEVHLTGGDNKGGQVRVVHIPEYVRGDIAKMLMNLQRTDNLFSRCSEPFNESYFNTAWSRAYEKMEKLGLIHENQTIYSFRHTAAVEVYRRNKDVHLLQKLLGHSSIVVTLKYLRSLGELNSAEMRDAAPMLE